MKAIKSLFALTVAAVALTACNDLQQEPLGGSTVTADQKQEIVEENPDMISASVNALPNMISSLFAIFGGDPRLDSDFGIPSIYMILDHRGQDMVSALNNYQWYTAALEMSDFGGNYYDNFIIWNTYYNLIASCNAVCGMIDGSVDSPEMQYYRAQALAFRGYAYLNLAQLFQFTYVRNPQAPTVPVITDLNLDIASTDGMPRATCEQIYAQVNSDLNEALALLDKAATPTAENPKGVTRDNMASGSQIKTFVNQTVIYGLLARKDLLVQDYAAAGTHVTKAIELATAEGLAPYSRDDVSKPGMTNINDKAWVWGFYTDPSANVGLQCWGGQMMPWHGTACYPGAGVYRCINKKLYESISANDVRKNWWFNGTNAPKTLPSQYSEYLAARSNYGLAEYSPYMQVKFGAYNDEPGKTVNAEDVPMMRVEELYLMLAEAQGMQTPGTGATTLTNFVSTYRQPGYKCSTTSKEEFLDEVWKQRRIELWGEGFSYLDLMRFQKGIDRRGGGYDPTLVFVIEPTNPVLIYEINTREAQANIAIGAVSNNASVPSAVPDI